MIRLFVLKLKSQRYLLPLLVVVVLFQLVLGQASSYVLADRQPPLSIAVQRLDSESLAAKLVEDLSSAPEFSVIAVDSTLSHDEVFRQERVQGLLIIPENFSTQIQQSKRSPVLLYPAPGITNRDFAREQIANAIMQLRAKHDLTVALESIGALDVLNEGVETADLLDVVYQGPALQSTPQSTAIVYGVSALLMLLAWLHAALTVPTREDKRLVVRGRRAFIRQFFASLAAVWVVWLVVAALYFVALLLFLGVAPDPLLCLGYLAIIFYISLCAALLAQFVGRHVASWVFLPLFLLNMTIGGGLWAEVIVSPLLSPLVPLAAVTATGSSALLGLAMLFGSGAAVLVASLIVISRRTRVQVRSTAEQVLMPI